MRALVAGACGLLIAAASSGITAGPVVHQYPVSSAGGAAQLGGGWLPGEEGAELLFPEPNADAIARLSTDGSVTQRRLPDAGSRPLAIARESASARTIVFTEVGTNRIGVIEDDGTLTEYDIPTPGSDPRGIAAPDQIWFTEYGGNRIGRLTRIPFSLVEYPLPTPNAGALRIAPGPAVTPGGYDLWFTEFLANKIGRIDQNGAITEYAIPTPDSGPTAITSAVEDDDEVVMYFTESKAGKIGRITRAGVITEFRAPTPNSGLSDIVAYADGVWFAERFAGRLGRLSFDGEFDEFPLPPGARPDAIAITSQNPDGSDAPTSIWWVDGTNRIVGRLSENRLFAVGAGHDETFDTDFELSGVDGTPTRVRLGTRPPGSCPPGGCVDPGVVLEVPGNGTVATSASLVPNTDGVELYMVTSERLFGVANLPAARAWIVETDRPDARIELPFVDYWSVADAQPPVSSGSGHQPSLTFPARRLTGVHTDLVLAALEADAPGGILVRIEAILPGTGVVASESRQIFAGQSLFLSSILTDLGYYQPFTGEIRVTRQSLSGLFWGLSEIRDGDRLLLLPPGSTLDEDCSLGPARCNPPRRTRVVTREANP